MEREETVFDPTGNPRGLVLLDNDVMVIDSQLGGVDLESFNTEKEAELSYQMVKLQIQRVGSYNYYEEFLGGD